MKYKLKYDFDLEVIAELPMPFLGKEGDYIKINGTDYRVNCLEWDYDQKTVWVYVCNV